MTFQFITSDTSVLNSKPIIKGTRISVEYIMEWIASGGTLETLYKEYDHLPKGSAEEAIMYAAQFTKNEILIEEHLS